MQVSEGDVFATRRIPDEAWAYWWGIGALRTTDHRSRASSEYVHPNSHELGAIGEFYFGWLVGKQAANDINPVAGDDGSDYTGVDVKAVDNLRAPWLKVRAEKVKHASAGFAFALVAVDIPAHTARYCGYATKEQLLKTAAQRIRLRSSWSTEHTGLRRSAEYGPESYIIRNTHDLSQALPPGFALSKSFL